jgi:hypothetical protein
MLKLCVAAPAGTLTVPGNKLRLAPYLEPGNLSYKLSLAPYRPWPLIGLIWPILTTDAMVAELPKKEEAPQMPPGGGGMDY